MAKAYVDLIDLITGNSVVVINVRCYRRGEVQMEIGHYLTALVALGINILALFD